MDNINRVAKHIYYLSLIILFVIYLFPGSLIGYLLYGDLGKQPNLISNPAGTSINHFVYFLYLSIIGLFGYLYEDNFKGIFIFLLSLSIILEVLHFIIPNRTFELLDLITNLAGVLFGYCIIIIYKKWRKYD